MNGYICFFKHHKIEVHADTMLDAKELAARQLKVRPSQQHQISVHLAIKASKPVVHAPMM